MTSAATWAAVFGGAACLAGCGETSVPYPLPDGCYYSEEGTPILRIRGDQGFIMTPPPGAAYPNDFTFIHRVRLRAGTGRDGPFLEITPSIYLTDPPRAVLTSSEQPVRVTIRRGRAGPVLMMGVEPDGATVPVALGQPC